MAGTLTTTIRFNGVDNVSAMLSRLQANVSAAASRMNAGFDAGARRLAGMGAAASATITAPASWLGAGALRSFADYEDTLLRIQSLSGATTEQMREYNSAIFEAARAGGFSGNETAKAFAEITASGTEAANTVRILDDALQGARAAGRAPGEWSDQVTNIMKAALPEALTPEQFEKDFRLIQGMAIRAANESSAGAGEVADFLTTAMPAGRQLGIDPALMTGLAGQFADRGLKGADAGRGLRSALLKLAAPEAKGLDILKKHNIDLDRFRHGKMQKITGGDLSGDLARGGVNLAESDLLGLEKTANLSTTNVDKRVDSMIENIRARVGNLTDENEERIRDALTRRIAGAANVDVAKLVKALREKGLSADDVRGLAGLEGLEYFDALMGSLPGAEDFRDRAKEGSEEYTSEVARVMSRGLRAAFGDLSSTVSRLSASILSAVSPTLQQLMRGLGDAFTSASVFLEANTGIAKFVAYAGAAAVALGPLAIAGSLAMIAVRNLAAVLLTFASPVTRAVGAVFALTKALALLAVVKPTSLAALLRFGAVGVVFAGAAAGAMALWNSLGKLKEVVGPSLAAGFNELGNALDAVLTGNGKGWIHFAKAGDRFREALAGAGSAMAEALAGAGPLGQAVLNAADAVGGFVSAIADLDIVKTAGGWLSDLWSIMRNSAVAVASRGLTAFADTLRYFGRVLRSLEVDGAEVTWLWFWFDAIQKLENTYLAPLLDSLWDLKLALENIADAGMSFAREIGAVFGAFSADDVKNWSDIGKALRDAFVDYSRLGLQAFAFTLNLVADGLRRIATTIRELREAGSIGDVLSGLGNLASASVIATLAAGFVALSAAMAPAVRLFAGLARLLPKPFRILALALAFGALMESLTGLGSSGEWAAFAAGLMLILPYLGKVLGVVGRLAGRFGILAGAIARVAKGLTGLKNIKVPPVPRAPRAPATVPNRPGPTGPKIPMSTTPANPPAGKPGIGLGWWKGLGLAALGIDAALQTEGKSKEEIEALFHERGKSFRELNDWLESMLPKALTDALAWSLPGAIGDAFSSQNAERSSLDAAAAGQMDDRARRGRAGNVARWQEQQNLLDLKLSQPTSPTGILNDGPLPPLGDPVLAGAGSGMFAGQQARTTESVDSLRQELLPEIRQLREIMTQVAGAARDTASGISALPSAIRAGIMAGVNRAAPAIATPPGAGRGLTPG